MRLLALALALVLAPAASAQLIPSIDLGIAGGVNFGSLGDASDGEFDNSTGYHIGAYADVGVLFFAGRLGLYYQRIGSVPSGTAGETETINFVTVPIDFQLQTPTPFVKAYALIGPEFRFPLDDIDFSALVDNDPNTEAVGVNTAINFGVGAKGGLPLFGPSGFAEIRYAYDLNGIADTDSGQSVKVNVVMLRIGVGI